MKIVRVAGARPNFMKVAQCFAPSRNTPESGNSRRNKEPSPWGCTPEFFEDIVKYALNSGARILRVVEAREALGMKAVTVNEARN